MLNFASIKKRVLIQDVLDLDNTSGNLLVLKSCSLGEGQTPQEILEKYCVDIGNISAYVREVELSQITIYNPDSAPWYTNEFKSQFTQSKEHAANWLNNIAYLLQEVPSSIVQYDDTYTIKIDDIKNLLESLSKEQNDEKQQKLIKLIQELQRSVKLRNISVEKLEKNLRTFLEDMVKDCIFFEKYFEEAKKSMGVSENKIVEIEHLISEIRAEIKYLQDVVVGTSIASAATGAVGAVLTLLPPPFGIICGIFCAAATFSLLLTAILESQKLDRKQNELALRIDQLSDEEKQLTSLIAFKNSFELIIHASKKSILSAGAIADIWKEIDSQMDQFINNLDTYSAEAKCAEYSKMLEDINTTNDEWNAIVETARLYSQFEMTVEPGVHDIPLETTA